MLAPPEPLDPSPSPGGIASGYAPPAGTFDELMTPAGEIRPAWRSFLAGLDHLGRTEVTRRWEKAQHLIHENGVSYNVYGDPQGMDRPWSLSPLPVLIAAAEWAGVAVGLAQRARLLDRLLADLYGPQRALTEGLLPPELVFGHPGFLRACHGLAPPGGRWLPLYGADFVRVPDGRFVVLADRTQAPSGAGYALENRIVVSRALPDLFREHRVERLARFFRSVQETLARLAPHDRDNPRVVLLTPGPHNATYFEQAYLAQYLGYTLVNGADLTVRDDRVYLKTLGGLQGVDVILRRVNDDYADPLELRPESVLGVPGLVQAARQRNVALANPLGTGLLQTGALLPYLPRLAQALLGEDLRLPSVATWWCGDPAALSEVLGRMDGLVFKPTFPAGFVHPIFGSALTADERANLATQIKAEPRAWLAQEQLVPSTTPELVGGRLVPRTLVLRTYATAPRDERGDYTVMPGALARVAESVDKLEVSMQVGAGSKDTWILADGPVSSFSLLPPASHAVELTRGGGDLPSRAADNLYWLGRYAERAEGVARLCRVVGARVQDAAGQGELGAELAALYRGLAAQTDLQYAPEPGAGVEAAALSKALWSAIADGERAGSLAAVVKAISRAARTVRDRLSADTWRVLTALGDDARALIEGGHNGETAAALNRCVLTLAAFQGLAMESMTRGQAWRFLDMGRRLERAATLLLLMRSTLCEPCEREAPLLEAFLEIADSSMTYRRRYLANLQLAPVVDLLLTDETNPRSVVFQLQALVNHILALPPGEGAGVRSPQHRLALGALSELQLADVEALVEAGAQGRREALDASLDRLSQQVAALSDSLASSYLNHAAVSRHLRGETRGDSRSDTRGDSRGDSRGDGRGDDLADAGTGSRGGVLDDARAGEPYLLSRDEDT